MTPPRRTQPPPEEEERPSEIPQEQPAEDDQVAPAFRADEELSEGQIPSFPGDDSPGESGFDFSALQSSEAEFTPLPSRLSEDEPIQLPGTRRRRRQNRLVTRPDVSQLGTRLESMARRAAPTFDFFFFSLLAGAILGLGYMLDAPAILLFGILVAPVLAPWVGVALAAATGETGFLGQTLGGFLTALLIVFITGVLAGLAIRIWMPVTTNQAFLHAQLWIPDLLLIILGTFVLTVTFIQSEEKPLLASLMVAYEIYLPASAAGFGLGSGVQGLWLQGLVVLLVHLAISIILALIVFYYMGFRPLEVSGYALAGLVVVGLALVAGYGINMLENVRGNRPAATILSPTPALSQATFTPFATLQPTSTNILITPTPELTLTPTLLPTPVFGRVGSSGAYIRDEPGGAAITTLQSGILVEFLPGAPVVLEGTTWVHVNAKAPLRDIAGWILLNLIVTATPSAPSIPTSTPTASP
jgi:hypothetical protein